MDLTLRLDPKLDARTRARISYAARVFAAIYGHSLVIDVPHAEAGRCFALRYGGGSESPEREELSVPARYPARDPDRPGPKPVRVTYAGEEFHVFHGLDPSTGRPDYLGEIFEWLSAADERSIRERDAVGRIPFEQTLFHRANVSATRAHAARMMAWLQGAIDRACGTEQGELPKAPSPLEGVRHCVVCTHDVDFYFTSRNQAVSRIVKNMLIAAFVLRSPGLLASSLCQLARLLGGAAVGDFLPALLGHARALDFHSTIFVISRRGHRRDANYALADIAPRLAEAERGGMDVGVHGSYCSVIEGSTLRSERERMQSVVASPVLGSRLHWLRFDAHERLFRQIEEAGFAFDSTLGFSESVGFRNGASFAFPPYDFARESPCEFLEIPLVLMDATLASDPRWRRRPAEVATEILAESRRWGWGGIAMLWHNPIEALGISPIVNRVFWRLLEEREDHGEVWMTGREFVKRTLHRYQRSGLLESLKVD